MQKPLSMLLLVSALFCANAFADEKAATPATKEISTSEKAFVESINQLTKAQIVEKFGQPAKSEEVKLKDSGRVVASIWQYHNLNKDETGKLYETTELDFIDDKVVMVVFMNHDGTEVEHQYNPEVMPKEEPLPEIKPVEIETPPAL